jgi:hypothetical protein
MAGPKRLRSAAWSFRTALGGSVSGTLLGKSFHLACVCLAESG